jgi:DNA-binding MarR family transcriptional regulator
MHMLVTMSTQEAQSGPAMPCNCTAVRKASRRLSLLYDAAVASSGLKTTQLALLMQIANLEPVAIGPLAKALVMDSAGLAHTLKPLERDGLISIKPDRTDARSRLVRLTARGRQRAAAGQSGWWAAQQAFEAIVGRERAAALRETLQFLASDDFVADFESRLEPAACIAIASDLRSSPRSRAKRAWTT